MHTPDIPAWLKELPKHSLLSSKDVIALFGYKNVSGLHWAVHQGCFPKPDERLWRGKHTTDPERLARQGDKAISAHDYWKAVTVRNEIRRRKRKCSNSEK